MKNKNRFNIVLTILVTITVAYFIVLLYGFNIISFDEKGVLISHHNFKLNESFKDSGTTGDTIGGIFGPIISIIASILTYWAFMEQVEANNKQFDEINRIKYNERFDLLLSIYRDNVQKVESERSFQDIFDEFKFIYLVILEKVNSDISVRRLESTSQQEKIDLKINYDDIVNISFAVLIFGLDSAYDKENKTLKVRTSSTDTDIVTAYLKGLERLNELITLKANNFSVESVTYNCEYQYRQKKHELKVTDKSFKGCRRDLENYFKNLDIFLDYICSHFDESVDEKEINNFGTSIAILESQLTLHELLLLYFYGRSIISDTFGNLFLESNLIFSTPLEMIDFIDTFSYKGVHIDTRRSSRYTYLFKS
ncbi:hypothetical protein QM480_08885 [Flectobacillus sp. DC10W]|uniref:Phage abortive infection protein n=1 Tax=Flectobacillus longus TaxID=2984207 RepID=A0ABT6YLI2_9BACT|nr:hypothetical protein [Flectobacillus longus]MDI9864438.1 hypothetical protein [Flectobacillus longus]